MTRPAIQVRLSGTLTVCATRRAGRIHRSRLRSVITIGKRDGILQLRMTGYTWWAFPRRRERRMAGK